MKRAAVNTALVILSTLVSLALAEVAYRLYLYQMTPDDFAQSIALPATLSFYDRSIWRYDREFGYRYEFGGAAIKGTLENGRLAGCTEVVVSDVSNALPPAAEDSQPRVGVHVSDLKVNVRMPRHTRAAMDIVVFGDSVTAQSVNGRTWPDYLRDMLEQQLRTQVRVVNFGMGGIGMLQMLDIAANRITQLKPDLAVIAFITDDLNRDRIWRTTAEVDGRLRVFTSTQPAEAPDLANAVDTTILAPEVTWDWCRSRPVPDRTDPIIQDIEQRYRLAVTLAGNRADLYSLNRAFLADRFLLGTPFRHRAHPGRKSVNPRHSRFSFLQDEQVRRSIAIIRSASVPVLIVHLAIRSELRHGKEYIFDKENQQRALLASLEEAFASKVAETMEHLGSPVCNIEGMGITATDDHPSECGMKIYGRVVADAILRRKLIARYSE